MSQALRRTLLLAIVVRIVAIALVLAGWAEIPFSLAHHGANFLYPFGEEAWLGSAFKTWDGNHYLFLAEQGYRPFHISNAFYPLFPALVRATAFLAFGNTLVAALLVSNALSVVSVGLFHALVTRTHDEETASAASVLLLAFPTAFYMGLVYSESLFLALAVGLLLTIRSERFLVAAILAALLPLSRPTGILVAIPAAVALFDSWRRGGPRSPWRLAAVPVGFLAGLVGYFAVMRLGTGDALAGFDAQKVFQADNSLVRLLHPVDWFLDNFVNVDLTLHGFRTSTVNRAFFVLFLPVVALSLRRLPADLLAYLLVVGLLPGLTGSLTSFPRYVFLAFPMFVTLALLLRRRLAFWSFTAGTTALQVFALLLHTSNRWVA